MEPWLTEMAEPVEPIPRVKEQLRSATESPMMRLRKKPLKGREAHGEGKELSRKERLSEGGVPVGAGGVPDGESGEHGGDGGGLGGSVVVGEGAVGELSSGEEEVEGGVGGGVVLEGARRERAGRGLGEQAYRFTVEEEPDGRGTGGGVGEEAGVGDREGGGHGEEHDASRGGGVG